ncbi:MAG TPA: VIT1/CCC1 transporter family protein [Dehalococcoidia bacterium]|jgi:VIT1/CCC1 family predicted Fe2+/Mn2+ transporter
MNPHDPRQKDDIRRWQSNLKSEWEASALYQALANAEKDPVKANVFRKLAEVEDRHASRWEGFLRASGAPLPSAGRTLRGRVLHALAGRFGARAVLHMVVANELAGVTMYDDQADSGNLPREERGHARIFSAMTGGRTGADIAASESWHRRDSGGGLRAAVFGVNDGLVSNLSLVFGVAGANPAHRFILLAGLAGLLGGSFSMAAGEFISVTTQRELFERQIALEKDELENQPEEEAEELSLIYQAKGIPEQDAERLAHRIIGDKAVALDTLAREELGLDPDSLGSPWQVAGASGLSFGSGAIVPVIAYFFSLSRWTSLGVSAVLSVLALIAVGLGISVVTGKQPVISAARMVLVGSIAAAVTITIGHIIGVTTS